MAGQNKSFALVGQKVNSDGNMEFYNTATNATIMVISRTEVNCDVTFKAPTVSTEGE